MNILSLSADFGLATSTKHTNRERLGTAKVRKVCL
jgi:hypothetical protein